MQLGEDLRGIGITQLHPVHDHTNSTFLSQEWLTAEQLGLESRDYIIAGKEYTNALKRSNIRLVDKLMDFSSPKILKVGNMLHRLDIWFWGYNKIFLFQNGGIHLFDWLSVH